MRNGATGPRCWPGIRPQRFVLEWKVNPDAAAPTEIEVTFTAEGDGTRVEILHRGWERLGEAGPEARASYSEGWIGVLDCFAGATER